MLLLAAPAVSFLDTPRQGANNTDPGGVPRRIGLVIG